ncbi:MAG: HAD-IB family hydrolase [Candidatus Spechtbacterales bacterium]
MKKSTKQKLAVFDIDGTIFRSSLLIELVERMIEEGLFPQKMRVIYGEEYQRWLDRRGSYDDYIKKVVGAYISNIKGVRLSDAMDIAERLMIFHKNRVYRYTRDLVSKLKKTHFLLAISHSPYHIVEPFCREWGFQKVYAMIYEIDENEIFTGRVMHEDFMKQKDKVLKRAVEKENLTLKGSVGVGDSESDIPMLKMVSRPIAFNPNRNLYQAAKRNRWEIVVERKDMIYKL